MWIIVLVVLKAGVYSEVKSTETFESHRACRAAAFYDLIPEGSQYIKRSCEVFI